MRCHSSACLSSSTSSRSLRYQVRTRSWTAYRVSLPHRRAHPRPTNPFTPHPKHPTYSSHARAQYFLQDGATGIPHETQISQGLQGAYDLSLVSGPPPGCVCPPPPPPISVTERPLSRRAAKGRAVASCREESLPPRASVSLPPRIRTVCGRSRAPRVSQPGTLRSAQAEQESYVRGVGAKRQCTARPAACSDRGESSAVVLRNLGSTCLPCLTRTSVYSHDDNQGQCVCLPQCVERRLGFSAPSSTCGARCVDRGHLEGCSPLELAVQGMRDKVVAELLQNAV